jgi:hypothetical protein
MKITKPFLFIIATGFAMGAAAGTPLSGTQVCKTAPPTSVAIGDKPDHAYAIITAHCTWTKPIEMLGMPTREGDDFISTEMSGNSAADSGYYVSSVSNGDKYVVRFSGTSKSKDGKPVSGQGSWSFAEGEGKLKGIKGGGTYKGIANADGSVSYDIKGEYTLAAAAP